VGTGTGLQLKAIRDLAPDIQLFGLDLSQAAIDKAAPALSNLTVDLRVGSIKDTDYPNDFFYIVTCNASMSYWEDLQECFDEIYRILKPGGQALLFEPHQDIDLEQALDQIKKNMADRSWLRRWGAVQLNKFGLKRGSRLGMTLYSINQIADLARGSKFAENYQVSPTSLLKIPIFMCVQLYKKV
jgi:ubiquinone/menaquinone biosynthesis C-methylase UbiE